MNSRTLLQEPASTSASAGSTAARFRPELQGLRALAILLVVVYHVWVGRVSGGVDTFLLVSTFLMTMGMMRRIESCRPLRLAQYWGHVFRRLLPAAAVTIAATLLVGAFLIPAIGWPQLWSHGWASLLYAENWRLITDAVDYYAPSHLDRSPFQHFWSLSMQGQVFIVWPIVFLVGHRIGKARGAAAARRGLIAAFSTIFVASLVWSVISTNSAQEVAYFDTFARLWEFALGSLLALLIGERQLRGKLGVVAGWVGVLGLISCGMVIDVAGAFPGFAALWPLGSAALVIAAGQTDDPRGADRLLAHPISVRIGGWSYGLYLAHWPILIYWAMATGEDHPGFLSGAVIIALSLACAWLLTRYVDTPVRSWTWPGTSTRRTWMVVAACLAVAAVPLGSWQGAITARAPAENLGIYNPGALALSPGVPFSMGTGRPAIPDPARLDEQWMPVGRICETELASDLHTDTCWEVRTSPTATRQVVAIGSSHLQQYLAAIKPLAERYDWDLYAILGPACGLGLYPDDHVGCEDISEERLRYLLEADVETVMLVGTTTYADGRPERIPDHADHLMEELLRNGTEVVAFRANPRFPFEPAMCLLESDDPNECVLPWDEVYAGVSPMAGFHEDPRFHEVNLSDQFCPDGLCPPVIGNVYVYFDEHHVTRLYGESLTDFVEENLRQSGFEF